MATQYTIRRDDFDKNRHIVTVAVVLAVDATQPATHSCAGKAEVGEPFLTIDPKNHVTFAKASELHLPRQVGRGDLECRRPTAPMRVDEDILQVGLARDEPFRILDRYIETDRHRARASRGQQEHPAPDRHTQRRNRSPTSDCHRSNAPGRR
ncbi:hypothetical protein [Bogoriella caseilytica]|uniref:hypothetical protein n=1 Tax=Bogoriella caseilytica TaxID=56055 RepID=UPI0011CE03D0|nr:hypothetical protein [Bogoriella caseilytica]